MISQWLVMAFLTVGGPDSAVTFDPPVRLMAGDQYMGSKRPYPSPVIYDIDRDGKPEMIIGDLIGNLTVSHREGKEWSKPEPLKGADGKPLNFHNW